MTTTALISSQAIGTSTNIGDALFAGKATAASTTTAFLLSARITAGAGPLTPNSVVRVWFTSTSFNIAAGVGPAQLGTTARYVDLLFTSPTGGQVQIKDGTLEPLTGPYIHYWVSVPGLGTAATLDVNLVELP